MKLKTKNSKKKVIILIIVILVAAGLTTGAFVVYRINQTTDQASKDTTSENTDKVETIPQDKLEEYGKEQKQEAVDEDQRPDTPPDASLSITFTSVSQMDSTVRVRAEIDALISGGTCTLTLTKGADTVTKTAATHPSANVSTCQGFDIPVSELSPGTWNVSLSVKKDDRSGQATTTVDVS